jgi:hypothetical protein
MAYLGLVVWFGTLGRAMLRESLSGMVIFVTGALFLMRSLLQFHCLDCGRTGRLARWREHACERVVARQLARRPRWFRGPTPGVQTVLWTLIVAVAGLLVLIARR